MSDAFVVADYGQEVQLSTHVASPKFDSRSVPAGDSDTRLRKEVVTRLRDLMLNSEFVQSGQLEPTIGSEEGGLFLKQIENELGHPPAVTHNNTLSIFTLLCCGFRCLLCGDTKRSTQRAVGCIRSHLNHRPFVCKGRSDKCIACAKTSM